MKLFIDTANLAEIDAALGTGAVCGITTNPSLLSKEPKGNYLEHVKMVVALARRAPEVSLSVEVFTNDHAGMVKQAEDFRRALGYPYLAVKIPISFEGKNNLAVVRELSRRKIAVNCTACMTPMQAAMAAAAGAKYVSLFYNRIKDGKDEERFSAKRDAALAAGEIEDGDFDPDRVIKETRALIADYPRAEIIVGSIRRVLDVKRSFLAGAHIVTASYKVIQAAALHFKTDDAVSRFLADFESWLS